MTEDLLTQTEILEILTESRNPIYKTPNLIGLGSSKTAIFKVCNTSRLILVNGNKDTGRIHIDERHSLSSRIPFWKENGKLENPSKFHIGTAPIDYLSIARKIYKPENLNTTKNNRPELFDLFIGKHIHKGGITVEYKLLTYKDTGISHNLFISDNKKPFNKKKIIDLKQGLVSAEHDFANEVQIFNFSYYDHQSIELFKVIIRVEEFSRKEKWYVQVNYKDGTPYLTPHVKTSDLLQEVPVPFRMIQLDYIEVSWIEEIIKKILEEKYTF